MNDTGAVNILDCAHDGSDKISGIGLKVVSFCANTIKELAASAEIEDEVEIVRRFKIVVERNNIAMASRDMFQDLNFVSDLVDVRVSTVEPIERACHSKPMMAYHMFSTLHELLVDHFAGIISARLDVNGFFDYSIRSAAQRLSSPILIGDLIHI